MPANTSITVNTATWPTTDAAALGSRSCRNFII
jgi:hypothetical protein